MRKLAIAAMAALALSACGEDFQTEDLPPTAVEQVTGSQTNRDAADDTFYVVQVEGRRCIVFDGYKAGGISCDWNDR